MNDELTNDSNVTTEQEINSLKIQKPVTGLQFLSELSLLLLLGLLINVITLFLLYPALEISAHSPQHVRTVLILCFLMWLIRKNGE